jgi:Cytochrome C'
VTKTVTIGGSVLLAAAIGAALLLRPKPIAREELPASASIPPAVRQVVRSKMARHDAQMRALVSRVALLDDDGVARVAGEVFDEPSLARPIAGDELNGLLPERFFRLQDELKARARALVIASQRRDHSAIAEEFGALARSCVSCHQVFLHGESTQLTNEEPRR